MSKELLQTVIDDGVEGNLSRFFCDASNDYRDVGEALPVYDDDRFSNFQTFGEIVFGPTEKLVVVISGVAQDLTERSGKKAQYEKAKKILRNYMKYDAGIFVFSDAHGNFRFSLVYGQAHGVEKVFSSFRRFTYLVSKDQTNRTFLDRVGDCGFSSLDEVKEAFSVEKVNNAFYNEVANYYYRLTGGNKCERELVLPSVAEDDDKKYEEFAVRLIGRSIFCWFLKHKKSANGVPLMPTGVLSVSAVQSNGDYYHRILESLFFELMNKPVKDRSPIAVPESGRIPFLNGGLFEPHTNDYYQKAPNWGLKIPDTWFEDFFEVLERYNFTIDENSVVDADVSVDPEMMGRIFENLLAEVNPETGETARKATGSYYTPRAIVDYMVEQSLEQYLLAKTALSEEKLDRLLSYEDDVDDFTEVERKAVVTALKDVKTIDPACGSGAFPMGILHRMLLALEKVDPRLEIWRKQYIDSYHPVMRRIIEDKLRKGNEEYIRKLTTIQDSIYGVDIQPIAVEIAKLRCFLSLVVDEQVFDDEENRGIEPLPNLEFKFVAANTLIGLPDVVNKQIKLAVSATIERLRSLRSQYLNCYPHEKQDIINEFRATQQKLYKQNVEWLLSDTQARQLTDWDPFSYESCGWFDAEWMFGVSNGFDIVTSNPPYVRIQTLKQTVSEQVRYFKEHYASARKGNYDLYVVFVELGMRLLRQSGHLAYILPHKFFNAQYGEPLRKMLAEGKHLRHVVHFGDQQIFPGASNYVCLLFLSKGASDQCRFARADDLSAWLAEGTASASSIPSTGISQSEWNFVAGKGAGLFEKLQRMPIRLESVTDRIFQGIKTSADKIYIVEELGKTKSSVRVFSREKEAEFELEPDLLHPLVKGGDSQRYQLSRTNRLILFPYARSKDGDTRLILEAELKQRFPLTWEYLKEHRPVLEAREDGAMKGDHWFAYGRNQALDVMPLPKLFTPDLSPVAAFSYDSAGDLFFTGGVAGGYGILAKSPHRPEFLLALLNSRLLDFYHHKIATQMRGGWFSYEARFIRSLPIRPINFSDRAEQAEHDAVVDLADRILKAKQANAAANTSALEGEIDERVHRLYGLTSEEIAIVKDSVGASS